jgi:hypothetical protein
MGIFRRRAFRWRFIAGTDRLESLATRDEPEGGTANLRLQAKNYIEGHIHIDIVDGHFVHNITRFKDCIVTFHPETVTHPLNWPNRVFKDSARVGWAKIPSRRAM